MIAPHRPNCPCDICSGRMTLAEVLADQARQLAERGWVMHLVPANHPQTPWGFSGHTHGLAEHFDHPDFQIVLPIAPAAVEAILNELGQLVTEAKHRFAVGDVIYLDSIEPVTPAGSPATFIRAQETGREVLRVVLCDQNGCIEREKMIKPLDRQFELA